MSRVQTRPQAAAARPKRGRSGAVGAATTVGYAGSGTIADLVEQHAGAFDHGDQRLSPEEAVIATVDEAVTSRDYQWWAPPR